MSKEKKANKKGLGRGLGSLLGAPQEEEREPAAQTQQEKQQTQKAATEKVQFESKTDSSLKEGIVEKPTEAKTSVPDTQRIWQIPIEKLNPQKDQPRKDFDSDSIKELAVSIKEKGILQPIVARRNSDKEFEIIAGERRWRAAQVAGLERVPVILKITDEQNARELALIENIQREDLNPIEEAEAYESLINKYKMTQQELAEKLGKDRVTISNSMRLLKLHPDLRTYVKAGELSQGQAKVLLSVADEKVQKKIGFQVIKKKLTVRETEKLVAKSKQPESQESAQTAGPDINVSERLAKGLSEELQKHLKTRVAIDYKGGKGKIKIHFHSDLEFNQIVDKIRNL